MVSNGLPSPPAYCAGALDRDPWSGILGVAGKGRSSRFLPQRAGRAEASWVAGVVAERCQQRCQVPQQPSGQRLRLPGLRFLRLSTVPTSLDRRFETRARVCCEAAARHAGGSFGTPLFAGVCPIRAVFLSLPLYRKDTSAPGRPPLSRALARRSAGAHSIQGGCSERSRVSARPPSACPPHGGTASRGGRASRPPAPAGRPPPGTARPPRGPGCGVRSRTRRGGARREAARRPRP